MFNLKSDFSPSGDQQNAIDIITKGFIEGNTQYQTLLGVTGSGKTFTMANIIKNLGKKTLVLAHNKTLAAQLYSEFKEFFPDNAIEYFVSYYDYYQPEAYKPSNDTYIEKDASINDEIDKLRHSCTRSLLERDDVIVIASVSCIYGIGSPDDYQDQKLTLFSGDSLERNDLLKNLIAIQYERNDIDFTRGTFRVRGDTIEIFPAHEDSNVVRIEFFGDEIDNISIVDPLRGTTVNSTNKVTIYPSSHYVVNEERLQNAIKSIKVELREQLTKLKEENKLVEHQRLSQRTLLDIEMLEEMSVCTGIENYSRHLTQRKAGEAAPTLIDYFFKDFVLMIDESHMTVSQVRGMYNGDQSRKQTLVKYGFRLPSAMDNRPLNFTEFEERLDQVLYVSATPADYELEKCNGEFVEQIIRPTGLLDPKIEVRDATDQVDNLLAECKKTIENGFRILVTTLTKKLAEDLTSFYRSSGLKVKYLHSDIKTLERMEILKELRLGEFDILVGINLLREGLDLPEVALVAILDADKEGFLRSSRSLVQTIGRASRNSEGKVILYAYKMTKSMEYAISETERRRALQIKHNEKNNITPKTIIKKITGGIIETLRGKDKKKKKRKIIFKDLSPASIDTRVIELTALMNQAANDLDFENAIAIRDEIKILNEARLAL